LWIELNRFRKSAIHRVFSRDISGFQRGWGTFSGVLSLSTRRNPAPQTAPVADPLVFDRARLGIYTFDSPDVEREVLQLFVGQVAVTLDQVLAAEQNFMAHTLKGAAASVGALEIETLVRAWELTGLPASADQRRAAHGELALALERFRAIARV
jgi:hypothetical protein